MAHNLGLYIVAEGVETSIQLEYLKQRNCEIYQGFLFSKPVTVAVFSDLLESNRPAD